MDLYDLKVYHQGGIFVAPNATVVGDIWMGDQIAIWHGSVIRGDINKITYKMRKIDSLRTSALAIIVCCILQLLPRLDLGLS